MNPIMSDNWFRVEQNLFSVRRRLQTAETIEDFQTVGTLCRETIISLGQAILTDRFSDSLPEVSNTDAKLILLHYFQIELEGSSNSQFRAYLKSCYDLANALQHHRSANYTQAELCTEACANLVSMVRILFFKETSPPNQRFRPPIFASAEAEFVTTWIFENFDDHPVSKRHGFTLKGFQFDGPVITTQVMKQSHEYTVSFERTNWSKGAGRASADRLLDEIIIRLLTELDKEHFTKTGQTPA